MNETASEMGRPKLASFFSGAGGLDKGFERAGFSTLWANEFDSKIAATFAENFQQTALDVRSITDVRPTDIPEVDGFIGGPPCQSWSEAGARRGILDPRGQLFHTYRNLLDAIRPKFFLAENVSGFLFARNSEARQDILQAFAKSGYNVSYGLLSAADYGVPQDRERVIIVGYRVDSGLTFMPPNIQDKKVNLRESLAPLRDLDPTPVKTSERGFEETKPITAHHFLDSDYFSYIYMSRNRVREWEEQSFTIQASASHAPLHPSAPRMLRTNDPDVFEFAPSVRYRRLSVRECALIQTFPIDYKFVYDNVALGYKVVGNAVPVKFAEHIAKKIRDDLDEFLSSPASGVAPEGLSAGNIQRYG
jgi:DNA (cytosine-5)-methyltransferase 1